MKNNKFWFKPKKYGYGFTPISWEGWLATLIFILVLLISAYINNFDSPTLSSKEGLRFLLDVLILTTLFSILSKNKLDGELGWRWGNKK